MVRFIVRAVRNWWRGREAAPPPLVNPWTFRLVGAPGRAEAVLGQSSVVLVPAHGGGTVTALALYYGEGLVIEFPMSGPRPVVAGDLIRFDLFGALRAVAVYLPREAGTPAGAGPCDPLVRYPF